MQLILWRHAEAEDGLDDLARKLTRHGEQQARQMARWLAPQLSRRSLILTSPAVRTRQTAAALESESGLTAQIEPRCITDVAPASILAAAGWPGPDDPDRTIVIVGHQPTLGQTAALLMTGSPLPWSVRKGAIWWLQRRARDGGQTTLRAVIDPSVMTT